MATAVIALDQRIILRSVSWETYERLLEDLVDCSSPRLTFDRGNLEIMSPTGEHERFNRLLASFVEEAAEFAGIEIESLGSTTFKRADMERGFEPDSCFYVAHAECVLGKRTMDLTEDPPPDLVIEIDITSQSMNKFPIYAQIGVPEVWQYDGERLQMMRLEASDYEPIEQSAALPKLPAVALTGFLERSKTTKRSELLKSFREWLQGRDYDSSPSLR